MAWNTAYIFLLIAFTIINYSAGILIGQTTSARQKKGYLLAALFVNLGTLFFFKYFISFNNAIGQLFGLCHHSYPFSNGFNILLPIGISFYTFQTISYLIDVYRGDIKAERHMGIFAVYVSFFPQLVSGPISRSTIQLPQFREKHGFDYKMATHGLKLMAWGYFQKLVIADRLAVVVNMVYNDPAAYKGLPLLIATVLFAFQILCDFSGYSDIAIGAAQVMGYRLMVNFKRPYFATSIAEIWRRWHISLSSWVYDYVYLPLTVKYRDWGLAGIIGSLFVTFILIGLWHNAGLNFIIYGMLQGLAVSYNLLTTKTWRKISAVTPQPIYTFFSIFSTFSFWCFSLIFFRANSVSDAFYIIKNMFAGTGDVFSAKALRSSIFGLGLGSSGIVMILSIGLMLILHFLQEQGKSITYIVSQKPLFVRLICYYALIFSILLFGVFGGSRFIYYNF